MRAREMAVPRDRRRNSPQRVAGNPVPVGGHAYIATGRRRPQFLSKRTRVPMDATAGLRHKQPVAIPEA